MLSVMLDTVVSTLNVLITRYVSVTSQHPETDSIVCV